MVVLLLTHYVGAHTLPGLVVEKVKGLEGQRHFVGILMLQGYNARNAPRADQEGNERDGHSLEVSADGIYIEIILYLPCEYLLPGECQQ